MDAKDLLTIVEAFFNALRTLLAALGIMTETEKAETDNEEDV